MVLAPCGLVFEGGDVPERQVAGEVDDSQQGAVGAQAHAKHTVLDITNANTYTHKKSFGQILPIKLLILIDEDGKKSAVVPFRLPVWKTI